MDDCSGAYKHKPTSDDGCFAERLQAFAQLCTVNAVFNRCYFSLQILIYIVFRIDSGQLLAEVFVADELKSDCDFNVVKLLSEGQ